ncbi:MAG: hypothetical protein KAJ19_22845 [Gammaproteobacteria bacterium]|nr:hypothetical protein [Gammaproteobacteria bacterium]
MGRATARADAPALAASRPDCGDQGGRRGGRARVSAPSMAPDGGPGRAQSAPHRAAHPAGLGTPKTDAPEMAQAELGSRAAYRAVSHYG